MITRWNTTCSSTPSARTSRTMRPSAAPRPPWPALSAAWRPSRAKRSPGTRRCQSNVELAPGLDQYTMDSNPPVMPDAQGHYPVAMPGMTKVL